MDVRPWAQFGFDLASRPAEAAGGPWTSAVGAERAPEAIQDMLARVGCRSSLRTRVNERIWAFEFGYRKALFLCRVFQVEEDYLLSVEDTSVVRAALGLPRRRYAEILAALAREMAGDPRIRDLRWYYHYQVLTGAPGAPSPVAA